MRPSVRARGSAAAAALLSAIALAGCGSPPAEPSSSVRVSSEPELYSALPQSIKDAGVIVFAGDSHPPYRTVGPDGQITGIDRDFQDALSRVLGVRIETQIVDGLPAALDGMLAKKFDAFNGPVKATAEREQSFDTITWMTTHTSYVFPTGAAEITGAADLCGKRVAVVSGSVVEQQLSRLSQYCQRNGAAAAQAVGLADTPATLEAARAGRADAAGMTQAAAIDTTTQQEGAFGYVTQTQDQGASTDYLAMLVPKDSPLAPVMLEAFQQLFDDGTYADIIARYELTEVTIPEPVLNVNAVSRDTGGS